MKGAKIMDIEKLTNESQKILLEARSVATEHKHQDMKPLHLFAALINREEGIVKELLKKCGIDHPRLKKMVEEKLSSIASVDGPGAQHLYTSRDFESVFTTAEKKS